MDSEEFELASGASYFEKEVSHIPNIGDMVTPPSTVYPYSCKVEIVEWNYDDAPPHVFVKVSS